MANSREFDWWPSITKLAEEFIKFVNEQTNGNVELKEKDFEQVKDAYQKELRAFERKFYGKRKKDNEDNEDNKHNLDAHKIAALHIKAFLDVSPFYTLNSKHVNQEEFMDVQLYPNEIFAMHLMNLILISWSGLEIKICMEDKEMKWFIGLLNHFRLDIDKLDILSLSSIIYYIEDKYLNHAKE
jgi:hypothetical protein